MKRKRLILTAVLLACVAAVVVPNWQQLWWSVAYQTSEITSPDRAFGSMHFKVKRFRWMPGPHLRIPLQVCAACSLPAHSQCFSTPPTERSYPEGAVARAFGAEWERMQAEGLALPSASDPVEYHCTCPDPSHEWNR